MNTFTNILCLNDTKTKENMKSSFTDTEVQKIISDNHHLAKAIEELSILYEIAAAISSAMSMNQILEIVIKKCLKHFKVQQGTLMLLDKQKKTGDFLYA